MVKLNRIYTKGGDKGKTSLGDASRVLKSDLRIEALGEIDELNASIGMVRLYTDNKKDMEEQDEQLLRIQNELFDLGADICIPEEAKKESSLRIIEEQVSMLENDLDIMNEELEPLESFVLPGGSEYSAFLHVSRTLARRAERAVVALAQEQDVNPFCIQYLNRLSDFLFVMARFLNDRGQQDILWVPGGTRS